MVQMTTGMAYGDVVRELTRQDNVAGPRLGADQVELPLISDLQTCRPCSIEQCYSAAV